MTDCPATVASKVNSDRADRKTVVCVVGLFKLNIFLAAFFGKVAPSAPPEHPNQFKSIDRQSDLQRV